MATITPTPSRRSLYSIFACFLGLHVDVIDPNAAHRFCLRLQCMECGRVSGGIWVSRGERLNFYPPAGGRCCLHLGGRGRWWIEWPEVGQAEFEVGGVAVPYHTPARSHPPVDKAACDDVNFATLHRTTQHVIG